MKKTRANRTNAAKKQQRLKVMWVCSAFLLFLAIFCVVYSFWPFKYYLTVANVRDKPVVANITISNPDGAVWQGERNYLEIKLAKGSYDVKVEVQGYIVQEYRLDNRPWLKLNRPVNQTMILSPRTISLTDFAFLDPTTTLELGPKIRGLGKNILSDYFDETLRTDSVIMYGDYVLQAETEHFQTIVQFRGDTIYQYNEPTHKVVLQPDSDFIYITPLEAKRTINFMKDFMIFSEKQAIEPEDRGLPKQYYIYGKDLIVSLGKMLFLACEMNAYESKAIIPDAYFIPEKQAYWYVESAQDFLGCYEKTLIGAVPRKAGGERFEKALYRNLTGKPGFRYEMEALNTEKRGVPVAFTFDVESGRYLFAASDSAASPCESKDYSIGLTDAEIVCDKPEYAAWMSRHEGPVIYDDYSYPPVSGITGYDQILEYGERYGLPVTNFYVKKDLLAFEELDPELRRRAQVLVDAGLVEVGSHTRYHTNLGLVDESTARREIRRSKEFLEQYFNTTVVGFRGPYHSMIRDEKTHAKALEIAGYKYFTQYGDYLGDVPGSSVQHKQWNGNWKYIADMEPSEFKQMLDTKQYIITLDHPWNMAYKEGEYLQDDPGLLENHRTNVLTAISNGGIPVLAKDLTVS